MTRASRRFGARTACLSALLAFAAAAAGGALAAPEPATAERLPLWNISGRWDVFNGGEYLVLRQHRGGRLSVTVHHTCAPGHVERGPGRIRGNRFTARVEPVVKPPPPACVSWATIDVRVDPDGVQMRGRFNTDRGGGDTYYTGVRPARSLVRFRPRIVRRQGGAVQVLLRPHPRLPAGALARVSLCRRGSCGVRHGRYGPVFTLGARRCGLFTARVGFAGTSGAARRRLCAGTAGHT